MTSAGMAPLISVLQILMAVLNVHVMQLAQYLKHATLQQGYANANQVLVGTNVTSVYRDSLPSQTPVASHVPALLKDPLQMCVMKYLANALATQTMQDSFATCVKKDFSISRQVVLHVAAMQQVPQPQQSINAIRKPEIVIVRPMSLVAHVTLVAQTLPICQ